jgi:hypothetical protein
VHRPNILGRSLERATDRRIEVVEGSTPLLARDLECLQPNAIETFS